MTLHPATVASEAAVAYVGCVWIVSRHVLVAQALAAALSRRVADVRALAGQARALEEAPIDPREDLVLVLDDVGSESAVAWVRGLATAARARTLVMTRSPRGPRWGALLEGAADEGGGLDIDIVAEPRTTDEMAVVVERVCAGVRVVGERERLELAASWRRHVEEEEELVHRMTTLSPRELVVLDALAAGQRCAEIATTLGVADSTVRTHVRSIRRKLAVDSQLRAVLALQRFRSVVSRSAPVGMPSPRRPRE